MTDSHATIHSKRDAARAAPTAQSVDKKITKITQSRREAYIAWKMEKEARNGAKASLLKPPKSVGIKSKKYDNQQRKKNMMSPTLREGMKTFVQEKKTVIEDNQVQDANSDLMQEETSNQKAELLAYSDQTTATVLDTKLSIELDLVSAVQATEKPVGAEMIDPLVAESGSLDVQTTMMKQTRSEALQASDRETCIASVRVAEKVFSVEKAAEMLDYMAREPESLYEYSQAMEFDNGSSMREGQSLRNAMGSLRDLSTVVEDQEEDEELNLLENGIRQTETSDISTENKVLQEFINEMECESEDDQELGQQGLVCDMDTIDSPNQGTYWNTDISDEQLNAESEPSFDDKWRFDSDAESETFSSDVIRPKVALPLDKKEDFVHFQDTNLLKGWEAKGYKQFFLPFSFVLTAIGLHFLSHWEGTNGWQAWISSTTNQFVDRMYSGMAVCYEQIIGSKYFAKGSRSVALLIEQLPPKVRVFADALAEEADVIQNELKNIWLSSLYVGSIVYDAACSLLTSLWSMMASESQSLLDIFKSFAFEAKESLEDHVIGLSEQELDEEKETTDAQLPHKDEAKYDVTKELTSDILDETRAAVLESLRETREEILEGISMHLAEQDAEADAEQVVEDGIRIFEDDAKHMEDLVHEVAIEKEVLDQEFSEELEKAAESPVDDGHADIQLEIASTPVPNDVSAEVSDELHEDEASTPQSDMKEIKLEVVVKHEEVVRVLEDETLLAEKTNNAWVDWEGEEYMPRAVSSAQIAEAIKAFEFAHATDSLPAPKSGTATRWILDHAQKRLKTAVLITICTSAIFFSLILIRGILLKRKKQLIKRQRRALHMKRWQRPAAPADLLELDAGESEIEYIPAAIRTESEPESELEYNTSDTTHDSESD